MISHGARKYLQHESDKTVLTFVHMPIAESTALTALGKFHFLSSIHIHIVRLDRAILHAIFAP